MRPVAVNDRWTIIVPDHRAARPEWPWHEAARFASMHDRLDGTGAVVWDVGAELGDHAALFVQWGCRVVLLEPNPRAWPCIAATIEANDAEGSVDGWWFGFVGADGPAVDDRIGFDGWPAAAAGICTDRAGMAHLSGRPDPDPYPHQPTSSIDALVAAGMSAPSALTIDVEGAELQVIRGARATLEDLRPVVWLSVHRELMAGYGDDPNELHLALLAAGYDGELLGVDHEEHELWVPR